MSFRQVTRKTNKLEWKTWVPGTAAASNIKVKCGPHWRCGRSRSQKGTTAVFCWQKKPGLVWICFDLLQSVNKQLLKSVQAVLNVDNCWQSQRLLFTAAKACSSLSCAEKQNLSLQCVFLPFCEHNWGLLVWAWLTFNIWWWWLGKAFSNVILLIFLSPSSKPTWWEVLPVHCPVAINTRMYYENWKSD